MDTEIEEVVVAPKAPKLTSKELYDQSEALSQPDPKEAAISSLKSEVMQATGGAEIENKVWQAKKRDGSTGGVSLKFYFNCKLNEIETGAECMYDSLVSAPVSTLKPSATVAPVGAAKMKTKKCHNCN